ncbi:MAG: tRNA preQ1(34) S-adenosylmethionine ribosyltransferase-isomerase QueA [Oligoflexus sp.]
MTENLILSDFFYDLPEDLIAQQPSDRRDDSRLITYQKGSIEHRQFRELPELLPEGSLIILNDTRVIPGRLQGYTPHGGQIEIMLLSPIAGTHNTCHWQAIGRPMKKLHQGQTVHFEDGQSADVIKKKDTATGPIIEIEFTMTPADFEVWIEANGQIPLPPYIHRDKKIKATASPDRDRYQTVFASHKGSVAAPTAGLHFTPEILENLSTRGMNTAYVTLHVGAGTFLPVKTQRPDEHTMHAEKYLIKTESYQRIQAAIKQERPIIAVGTTSFRCLQAFHQKTKYEACEQVLDRWHETELFIYPKNKSDRFEPWAVNGLLTNFHQPESTLFMLVCALLGFDEAHRLYKTAVAERYRFFSYGDGNLLWL